MKKNFSKLPLRKGVGIVLLNNKNKVFVAKRIDNPKNFWQMPQGGVDGVEKQSCQHLYPGRSKSLRLHSEVLLPSKIPTVEAGLTSHTPRVPPK